MAYLLCGLLIALAVSGCATVVDGSSQPVTFNSQPPGVRISINGAAIGVTPVTIPLRRSENNIVTAQKRGYEEQQLQLQTKTNPYFWGNILIGGLLGSTTDYSSGAMIEYSPNMYFVTLEPKEQPQPQFSRGSQVPVSKERKVRNFILHNHLDLLDDIARGGGDYLSALYAMLDVPKAQHKITFKRIKTIAWYNRQAPRFAQAILEEYDVPMLTR